MRGAIADAVPLDMAEFFSGDQAITNSFHNAHLQAEPFDIRNQCISQNLLTNEGFITAVLEGGSQDKAA
eukprot:13826621-Alexandrium_andersonii.AAC.1